MANTLHPSLWIRPLSNRYHFTIDIYSPFGSVWCVGKGSRVMVRGSQWQHSDSMSRKLTTCR